MGMILNTSYFKCTSCDTKHFLFGKPDSFKAAASDLKVPILAELPLVPEVSHGGDKGIPYVLNSTSGQIDKSGEEWKIGMNTVAATLWSKFGTSHVYFPHTCGASSN